MYLTFENRLIETVSSFCYQSDIQIETSSLECTRMVTSNRQFMMNYSSSPMTMKLPRSYLKDQKILLRSPLRTVHTLKTLSATTIQNFWTSQMLYFNVIASSFCETGSICVPVAFLTKLLTSFVCHWSFLKMKLISAGMYFQIYRC